jgi:hypothetical protein
MTRLLTDLSRRNDWLLRQLFARAARGLPVAELGEIRRPYPAHVVGNAPGLSPERETERATVRRSYWSSAS